jgi:SAM-dependent methyltransferase
MRFASATDSSCQPALAVLESRLQVFYNSIQSPEYFRITNKANETWNYHGPQVVLLHLARPGIRVLDMGCGSAAAWAHLRPRGVAYTGVDWSAEQVAKNTVQCDGASFVCHSVYDTGLPGGTFDVVFSYYVIEHLVWPQRMLREMVRLLSPDGTLVVICPHYRNAGRAPSLPFGGPHSFRKKLAGKLWGQAAMHAFYRFWWPLVVATRREPFLINLKPTCLTEPYRTDNDAVYLPDRTECMELLTSMGLSDVSGEFEVSVPRDVCLIAARRTP